MSKPTPQEHPLTAMVLHWAHLITMFILIFTGIYIHYPWFPGAMETMQQWHYVSMYLFIATTVIRVYWAFFGAGSADRGSRVRVRDSRHFLPEAANQGQFWQTIRYYLFLRRTHPRSAKYNPLQKTSYNLIPLLVIVQAITGFAIFPPTAAFMAPLTAALGGVAQMREYHYLVMFVFIVFLIVHIYLSLAEEIAEFPAMFFGVRDSGDPSRADDAPDAGQAA